MRKSKNLLLVAFLVFAMFAVGCLGVGDEEAEYNGGEETEQLEYNGEETKQLEYTRGVLTENSFESEFLNLRFTLPDGFQMLTQQDMDDLMGFSIDVMLDDEGIGDLLQAIVIYEMSAIAPVGFPSVTVIVERLPFRGMTMEGYIEGLKWHLQEEILMPETEMDITFSDEIVTIDFAGETYTKVNISSIVFGMEMNQKYLLRQIDNRMLAITVAYTPETEAEMQMLLDAFDSF